MKTNEKEPVMIDCSYHRKYQTAYREWLKNPKRDGIMPTLDGLFIVAPKKHFVGVIPEDLQRA